MKIRESKLFIIRVNPALLINLYLVTHELTLIMNLASSPWVISLRIQVDFRQYELTQTNFQSSWKLTHHATIVYIYPTCG